MFLNTKMKVEGKAGRGKGGFGSARAAVFCMSKTKTTLHLCTRGLAALRAAVRRPQPCMAWCSAVQAA